jgi:hypothetical protein
MSYLERIARELIALALSTDTHALETMVGSLSTDDLWMISEAAERLMTQVKYEVEIRS